MIKGCSFCKETFYIKQERILQPVLMAATPDAVKEQSLPYEYLPIQNKFCPVCGAEKIKHNVNCDDCKHLNITEQEQRRHNNDTTHVCMFYNTRLFHRTNQTNHNSYLYPCDKCVSDNYINFVRIM